MFKHLPRLHKLSGFTHCGKDNTTKSLMDSKQMKFRIVTWQPFSDADKLRSIQEKRIAQGLPPIDN